jgi:hypothetical protein
MPDDKVECASLGQRMPATVFGTADSGFGGLSARV